MSTAQEPHHPSEEVIQKCILWFYHRTKFAIPNYTPEDWWECDVFRITDSGYMEEFEVKITPADMRTDKLKVRERWSGSHGRMVTDGVKHELLAQGSPRGPRRFWYVVPEPMQEKAQAILPTFAGLAVWLPRGRTTPFGHLRPVVQPRALHGERVRPEVEAHARGVCYYRLLNRLLAH